MTKRSTQQAKATSAKKKVSKTHTHPTVPMGVNLPPTAVPAFSWGRCWLCCRRRLVEVEELKLVKSRHFGSAGKKDNQA